MMLTVTFVADAVLLSMNAVVARPSNNVLFSTLLLVSTNLVIVRYVALVFLRLLLTIVVLLITPKVRLDLSSVVLSAML